MYLLKSYWKRIFDYKGVTARKEFFMTIAINIIIFMLINMTAMLFAVIDSGNEGTLLIIGGWLAYLGAVYLLLQILPTIALVVRRLHDHNEKWWLILLGVHPIGFIFLSMFFFMGSVTEDNKWRQIDIQ